MKQCALKTAAQNWGIFAVFIAQEIALNEKEKQGEKLA
jgi:hypothetical protein